MNIKNMFSIKSVFRISLLLWSASCFASSPVEFDHDVRISKAGETNPKVVKRGEKFELNNDKTVLVEAEGFIPVILVPISAKQTVTSTIQLHSVKEWPASQTASLINTGYDELIASTLHIQKLISGRQFDQALTELDQIQIRYPSVQFLNFYRANLLFLKGDRAKAIEMLHRVLALYPNNKEGRDLLNVLESK